MIPQSSENVSKVTLCFFFDNKTVIVGGITFYQTPPNAGLVKTVFVCVCMYMKKEGQKKKRRNWGGGGECIVFCFSVFILSCLFFLLGALQFGSMQIPSSIEPFCPFFFFSIPLLFSPRLERGRGASRGRRGGIYT